MENNNTLTVNSPNVENQSCEALRFIHSINRIENFPVEQLAKSFQYDSGEPFLSLPLYVKKAWFRAKYPFGHIEAVACGTCDANVANVRAEVYTGEMERDRILGHWEAVKEFNPGDPIMMTWGEEERTTNLRNTAFSLAASKALEEAGFGMGYSSLDYAKMTVLLENGGFSNLAPVQEEKDDDQDISEASPKQRVSGAAKAQEYMDELEAAVKEAKNDYSVIEAGVLQEESALNSIIRKIEKTCKKITSAREKCLDKASKATAVNQIGLVCTVEKVQLLLSPLPDPVLAFVNGETDKILVPSRHAHDEANVTVVPTTVEAANAPVNEEVKEKQEEVQPEIIEIPSETVSKDPVTEESVKQEKAVDPSLYEEHLPDTASAIVAGRKMKDLAIDELEWLITGTKADISTLDREAAKYCFYSKASADEKAAMDRRLNR